MFLVDSSRLHLIFLYCKLVIIDHLGFCEITDVSETNIAEGTKSFAIVRTFHLYSVPQNSAQIYQTPKALLWNTRVKFRKRNYNAYFIPECVSCRAKK